MKTSLISHALRISLAAGLLGGAAILHAQESTQTTQRTSGAVDFSEFGARKGDHEFMIGGSGATNKDLDDSLGGVSFAYGVYFTDTLEGVVRQTINYSNPNDAGQSWNGATRLAIDQHLTQRGAVRPFIGANFGRIYGDAVRDTWAAGLEAGIKYYVQPRTFILAMVEYGWFFQHSDGIDNRFDDGQWNWNVGVGFNF